MRTFITVLVLIFSLQSWTKANDIRDFQIEGMSIGDSLLDFYSKREINNFLNYELSDLHKNLLKLCEGFNYKCINMHKIMYNYKGTGHLWWDKIHLTDYGQEVFAKELYLNII